MLNQTFSQRLNDKAETRPVNFGKTIVVATVSLPQNVYDGNYNSFLQHFSLNAIVSEPFWGIKGTTREDLFIRMTIFFQKHKSQALVVGLVHHIPLFYVVLFTVSQLSDRSDSHFIHSRFSPIQSLKENTHFNRIGWWNYNSYNSSMIEYNIRVFKCIQVLKSLGATPPRCVL